MELGEDFERQAKQLEAAENTAQHPARSRR
jgi:hypothetical protein